MKVQLIRTAPARDTRINQIIEGAIKQLEPNAHPFPLPPWLTLKDRGVLFFEKQNAIIIANCLSLDVGIDETARIFEIKNHWEQLIKIHDKKNTVVLYLFIEKFLPSYEKFFSKDKQIKVLEYFYIEEEDKLYIKECLNPKTEHPEQKTDDEDSTLFKTQDREVSSSNAQEKVQKSGLKITPPSAGLSEYQNRYDNSLSAFFYKMGKFSEEELTRFLELGSDLSKIGNQ